MYLEFDKRSNCRNKENVRKVLDVIERFYLWSGLKINLGKTYVAIFGREYKKPSFVEELGIKWCNEFKLLGIQFDVTLSNMQRNFETGIANVKKNFILGNIGF